MDKDSTQQLRLAIQRLARRIRSNAADDEVPESQRSVLFTLDNHGRQSLGSLSDHERVTPPSMNRTVNALVTAGLVTRTIAEEDARRVELDLSDAGHAFVEETRRRRDAWFTQQLASLGEEERRLLDSAVPVLKKLAEQ
ncbi:MAG: MarR family transcriptional regulator [Cryobacterium sp.]|jgi:DNA-binding MarR family transcriptional regulator|nr:MarR family transcriptional regulator [Cryobacterium sp.]